MEHMETAALAGNRRDGKTSLHTNNANPTDEKKQGTPRYFLNGRRGRHG